MTLSRTIPQVSVEELHRWLNGSLEWALLDVREEGSFADGHLLFAVSVPLSRIELLIADLVPRRSTPIVLCGGTDLAERAAVRLSQLGYSRASLFPGNAEDWRRAGLETYTGIHVPSKAFGEVVESRCHTPHMDPQEVKARLDAGDDIVVLDSRPLDEYRSRCIPGAIDVPGVELVYRISDIVASPSTLVVVNCGGRTRSIIGAQSLIDAGVRNRVVALKNGTMGWHLAGYPMEHEQTRRAPPVSREGLDWSRAAAQGLARRSGVASIEKPTLEQWSTDLDRTLYLFDVRQPEEFALGHVSGSRHVQGGQLIQETDRNIAVRNSRIVLVDDTGVRAAVAGFWLRQMGYREVYVLRDGLAGQSLETGPWRRKVLGLFEERTDEITADALLRVGPGETGAVVDLSLSTSYRRGHMPGAYFAIRAQLREALRNLPRAKAFVVTSEDGVLARLAAPEVARLGGATAQALVGGNLAWQAAGGQLESGSERWAVPPQDVWLKPFDQLQGKVEDRLNDYLSWEVGLLKQLSRDVGVRFNLAADEQRPGAGAAKPDRIG